MKSQGFSDIVKQQIYEAQNGYCAREGCLRPIHSIHHKLHNTKYNRQRFPLFISSPLNGVGLCYEDHTNKSHLFKVTEKEARVYEEFLRSLKEAK